MVSSQSRAKKEFISDELKRIMSVLADNRARPKDKPLRTLVCQKKITAHTNIQKVENAKILFRFGGKAAFIL